MEIFSIFVLLILVLRLLKRQRINSIRKSVLFVFSAFWLFATVLAYLNFTGSYSINSEAYVLVMINVLSFCIGVYIIRWKASTDSDNCNWDELLRKIDHFMSTKKFKFFLAMLIIYVVYLFLSYLDALVLSSAAELRTDFFSEDNNIYGSSFLFINSWLLKPASFFLLVILPIAFIRKKRLLFLFILLFLLIYNSLGGGRFGYVQIFWSLFFVFVIVLNKIVIRVNFRTIFISILAVACLYIFIAGATFMRMSSSPLDTTLTQEEVIEETNNQISSYISGPIAALGYSLDKDYISKMGGYTYGKLTFASIDYFMQIVLSKIGLGSERLLPKFADIKQNDKIVLNDKNDRWNALYTAILFFYVDFGWVGVILLPMFFGFLVSLSLEQLLLKKSLISLVLANYCFLQVMHSVFDFCINDFSDFILILLISLSVLKSRNSFT